MWRTPSGIAAVSAWIAVAAAGRIPYGWTGLLDPTGRCLYAVPASWKMDLGLSSTVRFASSPDGAARANVRWLAPPSWTQFTSGLRAALHPSVIHEQSAARFWIEYASTPRDVVHLSTIQSPEGACVLEVAVHDGVSESMRQTLTAVVDTLTSVR
jgi:hypothetical protein